jgi:hypothetical protein
MGKLSFHLPRTGKPIARWGRKVMDLLHADRQTVEGDAFGGFFFKSREV